MLLNTMDILLKFIISLQKISRKNFFLFYGYIFLKKKKKKKTFLLSNINNLLLYIFYLFIIHK